MYYLGQIRHEELVVLVDSGANCYGFISQDVADRLGFQPTVARRLTATLANGKDVTSTEEVRTRLSMTVERNGVKETKKVHVTLRVAELVTDVILGTPFMRQFALQFDWQTDNALLKFGDETWTWKSLAGAHGPTQTASLKLPTEYEKIRKVSVEGQAVQVSLDGLVDHYDIPEENLSWLPRGETIACILTHDKTSVKGTSARRALDSYILSEVTARPDDDPEQELLAKLESQVVEKHKDRLRAAADLPVLKPGVTADRRLEVFPHY